MSTAPPVPPRPYDPPLTRNPPPPVPPLPPPHILNRYNSANGSLPHFEKPLIAPTPHHAGNMAQTLNDQLPARPPWSSTPSLTNVMANLTFQPSPPPPPFPQPQALPAPLPSLTAPLPVLAQLQSAASAVQSPAHETALKVAWCRDVFFLIDRANPESVPGADPPVGPVSITDPTLSRLAQIAVPLILQLSQSYNPSQGKITPFIAEAISMRATLAATGAFPDYVRHNPRNAFRDFESAARGGHSAAWFRLGRDYENFNDHQHARDCFERGVRLNVESCLYRMGMAHLLGQLSLPQNITVALPLLHRAATLATLQVPQPAYVYALLLLSEFTQITVPPALFGPLIPSLSSPTLEARKHLERAAFLHFPAAQYKLGHAYEFSEPPFSFDPLLSVQYYSLASEQGESEADMALSKWFLCGSSGAAGGQGGVEGGFDKDEALALTFADKAAKKGLPSAEFAMGYYAEVGVGRIKDIKTALRWYQLAHEHGNQDATMRLSALSGSGQSLSRQEHDSITENKLVRRRTLAAQKSESQPLSPPWDGNSFPTMSEAQSAAPNRNGSMVLETIRNNSLPPPTYDPPPSIIQSPPAAPAAPPPAPTLPSGGSPPQFKRYALSDGPPTGPVRAASPGPARKLRKNQEHKNSSSTSLGGPGRAPSPGWNPRTKSTADEYMGGASTPPVPIVLSPSPNDNDTTSPKHPTTFAEMGFNGVKAEDKDCIIM